MNLKFDLDNSKSVDQSTNIDQSIHNDYSKHKTKVNFNLKFLIIAIVVLAIAGGSFGIYKAVGGSPLERQLVGTWKGTASSTYGAYNYDIIYTFNANHTVTGQKVYDDGDTEDIEGGITWEINDSHNLIVSGEDFNNTYLWDENISAAILDTQTWYLSGNILYLSGVRFERQ